MASLFPPTVDRDVPAIPGLRYLPDYITAAAEHTLATLIDAQPWNTRWQRRRQPYGGAYGKGETAPPLPDWARQWAERLLLDGITTEPFDQVLVKEYLPGQGIARHRDYKPYGRTVVSLSLLSPCVMDFRHGTTGRQERLLLEPRSLLVLSDEARYDWAHGIAPRKTDTWQGLPVERSQRLSVTFRFVAEPTTPVAPPAPRTPRRSHR